MEKIQLKNLETIEILDGCSENTFQIVIADNSEYPTLRAKLTKENLSEYNVCNAYDVISATYTSKKFKNATIDEDSEKGIVVTVNLKDTTLEDQFAALQAEVAALKATSTETTLTQ